MKTKTDAMKTLIDAGWSYEDIVSVLEIAGNSENERIALPHVRVTCEHSESPSIIPSKCMPPQQPLDFSRGRTLWYKADAASDEAVRKLTIDRDIAEKVGMQSLRTDAFQPLPRFKIVSADLQVGKSEAPETDAIKASPGIKHKFSHYDKNGTGIFYVSSPEVPETDAFDDSNYGDF